MNDLLSKKIATTRAVEMSATNIERILKLVADRYDINYDDIIELVRLYNYFEKPEVIKETITTENVANCHAYVKNKKKIVQCSRKKTCGDFCKTHANLFAENKLAHGRILPSARIIEMTHITIDKTKYLYDPKTGKVYADGQVVNTKKPLGTLGENDDGSLTIV